MRWILENFEIPRAALARMGCRSALTVGGD
jgi:hypothetical protein